MILTIETNDLDLGTIAGNTALLARLQEATAQLPLRTLRATTASILATSTKGWTRGRCVHSIMTVMQRRFRDATPVMTPARVAETASQFGQKVSGREANTIARLLKGRH